MKLRVVVRVRPLNQADEDHATRLAKEAKKNRRKGNGRRKVSTELYSCATRTADDTMQVVCIHPKTGDELAREFHFSQVLDHATCQADFFEQCGIQKLIRTTLNGYAAVVFAYGQTGSGKTYTMSGKEEQIGKGGFHDPETDGLIPRSLSYMYAQIKALKSEGKEVSVSASYLEIYNEQVYDLLNNDGTVLPVRFQTKKGFYVENQLVVECESFEDLRAVAAEGHNNRTVRSHNLNMHSSRSHSIFTVYLDVKSSKSEAGEESTVFGKMSFIDLAGSENVKQSQSEGAALKETNNINKSLFALGKVISILAKRHKYRSGEKAHIPYRDSVLTKLLMDSLGGNCLAMMIACCSPSSLHVDETLRTLQYATRAKNIQNKPVQNLSQRDQQLLMLKEEIRQLRSENYQLRGLLSSHGISAPPSKVKRSSICSRSSTSSSPLVSEREGKLKLGERDRKVGLGSRNRPTSGRMTAPNTAASSNVALNTVSPRTIDSQDGSRTGEWWNSPIAHPVANFHDQTGMIVKSPKGAVNFSRESSFFSFANDSKRLSISQRRMLNRIERRTQSSRRRTPTQSSSRRTPTGIVGGVGVSDYIPEGKEDDDIKSIQTDRPEYYLAEENRTLKKRLELLENVFVKGSPKQENGEDQNQQSTSHRSRRSSAQRSPKRQPKSPHHYQQDVIDPGFSRMASSNPLAVSAALDIIPPSNMPRLQISAQNSPLPSPIPSHVASSPHHSPQ
eukprot:CAMPEP_0197528996 /NCGR_PEP_ID=MMETSP1318-20131121/27008_1 /TAXON_ID=552666 /ORGANISM="Partenskyella glossopodia, Strain RCC365" /LENGTH=730 /DNA_ID=CAMNT_0043084311 /DNA_START=121 /DNA_END=2310 /DNA_ORIENTATION=-